ncbi:MAG TPA: TA system VapC family ribonuclease toxin [Gemmatirosa sp.]
MTPDVNVLLAADRDVHPHHATAARWLTGVVASASAADPLTLLPSVVVGYVRLATGGRVYRPPTLTARALANVEALLAQPGVRLGAHAGEWPRVVELCTTHQLAGDILTDAWIAATVLHLGEHLVTFDRGFRRLLPPRHLTVLTP